MKTTITHPIYGRIEYDSGKDNVSVQRGDLAERIKWMLRPENERLLGQGIRRDQFIEACALLGILFGARTIKTTSQDKPGVKTIIESSIYGRITHDDETDRVTVQRGPPERKLSREPAWHHRSGDVPTSYLRHLSRGPRPLAASSIPNRWRRP